MQKTLLSHEQSECKPSGVGSETLYSFLSMLSSVLSLCIQQQGEGDRGTHSLPLREEPGSCAVASLPSPLATTWPCGHIWLQGKWVTALAGCPPVQPHSGLYHHRNEGRMDSRGSLPVFSQTRTKAQSADEEE